MTQMNQPEAETSEFNRREFLRGGSLATLMAMMGGVPLIAQPAPETPAEAKPPGTKIKVALIGLGPQGREILDQLNRRPPDKTHAEIVALCDTYPPMLRRSSSKAPGAKTVEDYKAVLDDKDVQAVIVATPTHRHKDIVVAALQAGKHVYCEAPIGHTMEDARAIALAAKNAVGQVFQAGLQMRCDPQRHWLMPFIRSGALGRFVLARSQWHKKQSWRATSPNAEYEKASNWRLDPAVSLGLPGEIAIHQLDQAGWFLDAQPTAVSGWGAVRFWKDGRKVADTVQLVLEYPGGLQLVYDGTLANSFDHEYEIYYGSDAAVMLRDIPTATWMFKEVDSALLGWEVYARKDAFYKDTGIALVAGASKQKNLESGTAQSAFPQTPLYYALEAFLNNCEYTGGLVSDFKQTYNSADPKALAEFLAAAVRPSGNEVTENDAAIENVTRRAPAQDVGYAATVLAIKANEAVRTGQRIELKKEWFEPA
jgi:predicted dehydrogenase